MQGGASMDGGMAPEGNADMNSSGDAPVAPADGADASADSAQVAPGDGEEAEPAVKAPQRDGFNFWCAVDVMKGDVSPYRVSGMAGNVSEWTVAGSRIPMIPTKSVPIRRGGFVSGQNQLELSTRRFAQEAGEWKPFHRFPHCLGSAPVSSQPE